jgi:hypothetical protein
MLKLVHWQKMTATLAELQAQLAIDKSVLDDEVIRQPVLFYTIGEQVTDAIAERDAAKEELASVDADLDFKGRKKLANVHDKVTETMVKNFVQMHPDHENAFATWLTAKTKADRLLALKDAFQQRSYMLRDLVSLYSANYYEDASLKPSRAQDASHYAANRHRISDARAARGGK